MRFLSGRQDAVRPQIGWRQLLLSSVGATFNAQEFGERQMSTSVVGTRGPRASRAIVVCMVVSWASISACGKEGSEGSPNRSMSAEDTASTTMAHEPPTPRATPTQSMPVEHLPPRQPESAPTPLVADSIKPGSSKDKADQIPASPTASAPTHRVEAAASPPMTAEKTEPMPAPASPAPTRYGASSSRISD